MYGICGTCARKVEATQENEGYSSCCNDRIEYGIEASETLMMKRTDLREEETRLQKKIRSLQSRISVAKKAGYEIHVEDLTKDCEGLKRELKWVRVDLKAVAENLKVGF